MKHCDADVTASSSESNSTISSEIDVAESAEAKEDSSEMTLLDMYSGCGAMSTGLCLGANSCGVRNESAEDFLALLKEWEQLCVSCLLIKGNCSPHPHLNISDIDGEAEDENSEDDEGAENVNGEVYEVEHILDVCYGDPNGIKKPGLYFKVHFETTVSCYFFRKASNTIALNLLLSFVDTLEGLWCRL
nr:DNA (cytosine-5)-methyltransferase CMT3-like [Ipomoea batatas]